MKQMKSSKVVLVACVICAACGVLAQGRFTRAARGANRGGGAAPAPAVEPVADAGSVEGASELNFNGAPVDLVLEAYSKLVDKTILKDPSTPNAAITLQSREGQKLTVEERISAIETVLEMNGVHLEPYGEKFVRAMQRGKVRKDGIPLLMNVDEKLEETMRVVSVMMPFKNIGVEEAQKALEGFKSDTGILLVFERTNSILVTDTQQNINRMMEIAKAIDIATPVLENVYVRQIKNASAAEIKTALEAIVQESQKEQEKNGKAVNNAAATRPMMPMPPANGRPSLLRRDNQVQAAVSAESLVMSVSDADRGMIRGKVLILADERSNKLVIVTQKPNMDFFDRVIEQLDVETTPDVEVKVYRLKYAEAKDVSDMINDLIGNTASAKSSGKSNQNQNARAGSGGNLTRGSAQRKTPVNQRSGESKAGELSKENVTVLADDRINGLVVMARKEDIPTIEQIIERMDVKLSQVLIETAIIEVTLGDDLQTGVDWVRLGNKQATGTVSTPRLGEHGLQLYNYTDGNGHLKQREGDLWGDSFETEDGDEVTTWTKIGEGLTSTVTDYARGGLVTGTAMQYMLGGGGGSGSSLLSGFVNGATNVSPISSGINYFFKSDKLNLGAVIQASKTDSRARYLASPIVMTVDNKEATIDATEARKFFNGYETSSSYSTYVRTPKYDSKDIGIKIKIKPKINPNGTVMLNVEEEYSQLGSGQTILVDDGGQATIDTSLTRKMTADVLLDNMQTVVLGGLTEKYTSNKETGIPILKDIPWIGKWLFGTVTQSESRKELLVFMTPYVLDDGDEAQGEALRRKKALSDPRPWDDGGWSSSKLADPVSKKEQLRRLKDEWKRQDEERKTKLAIESEKVKRAKELEKMSKEEREFWLEKQKEELDKEHQKELEEKMQDEKSQAELAAIAAAYRERKLKEFKEKQDEVDKAEKADQVEAQEEAKAIPAETGGDGAGEGVVSQGEGSAADGAGTNSVQEVTNEQ
jgi:type II secretion system protein D